VGQTPDSLVSLTSVKSVVTWHKPRRPLHVPLCQDLPPLCASLLHKPEASSVGVNVEKPLAHLFLKVRERAMVRAVTDRSDHRTKGLPNLLDLRGRLEKIWRAKI
jgi:hypothetical protein